MAGIKIPFVRVSRFRKNFVWQYQILAVKFRQGNDNLKYQLYNLFNFLLLNILPSSKWKTFGRGVQGVLTIKQNTHPINARIRHFLIPFFYNLISLLACSETILSWYPYTEPKMYVFLHFPATKPFYQTPYITFLMDNSNISLLFITIKEI